MKNQTVQLFNFGTATIRVIPDFKDGQPYFVAKDVAETLGFKNPALAIRELTGKVVLKKREVCEKHISLFTHSTQATTTLIPESDLYRLVMRSNLPSAQAFQDWVCGTVLPAIRKDGAYIMGEEKVVSGELAEAEFIARAMRMMDNKVERLRLENQRQAARIAKQDTQIAHLEFEIEKMTVRQWEVEVLKSYLSRHDKGRLAGALRGKAVEKIAAEYEGHATSINVYMREDLNNAARSLSLM